MSARSKRFIPIDVIAYSGTGEVWRAWDCEREDQCALKILGAGQLVPARRILEDSDGAFAHEHLLRPYALSEHESLIAMPLVSGGSLAEVVSLRGTLGESAALAVLTQMLEALATMHEAGWVHRRVGADTIMFREDRPPVFSVLAGMSAAIPAHEAAEFPVLDAATVENFRAPEVVLGSVDTAASDVYALAASILFALVGPSALNDTTVPAHLSPALARTLSAMLAESSDERPSAREALAQIPSVEPGSSALLSDGSPLEIVDLMPDIPEDFDPYEGEPPTVEPVPSPVPQHPPSAAIIEEVDDVEAPFDPPERRMPPAVSLVPSSPDEHDVDIRTGKRGLGERARNYDRMTLVGWAAIIAGMTIAIGAGAFASLTLIGFL
ncbi:protein kinase [Dermabacter vaginalis]|uniref:protein kinase domain-containing protein n=1 Tax=Dermabacter vaginalis TaxID=1630135 RepID=UPI0021A6366D|nr:protein kinase [Dermabacter vaginalis]MCT2150006.1 protein kinase [Dermabacter vaginalis]